MALDAFADYLETGSHDALELIRRGTTRIHPEAASRRDCRRRGSVISKAIRREIRTHLHRRDAVLE